MQRQDIRGASRLIALLGDPVAHSVSPQIHNHAFATLGLPYVYVPMRVSSADVGAAVRGLRACGFAGANVTIPHKQQVVNHCDRITALSAGIGAVNTLYWDQGALWGTSTDPEGFLRAIAVWGAGCGTGTSVILGNGGTARTIAFTVATQRQPRELWVAGRDENKAAALAAEVSSRACATVHAASLASPLFRRVMERADLCVNCTSVGMHPRHGESPVAADLFHAGMCVFDAVYNPAQTRFLEDARRAGCRAQNGLRMLLFQALASFKLWTGVEPREDLFDMREIEGLVEQSRQEPV